jgi:hypothetical protein
VVLVLNVKHPEVFTLLELIAYMDSVLGTLMSGDDVGGKTPTGQCKHEIAWCLTDNATIVQPFDEKEDWRTEISVSVSLCETAEVLFVPGPIGQASQQMRRVIKECRFVIRRRNDEWVIPTGKGRTNYHVSEICDVVKTHLTQLNGRISSNLCVE